MTAVIFDLDGTLVESAAAIRDIANEFMRELGLPLLDLDEAKRYIGNGSPVFVERALTSRGAFDRATFDSHYRRFQELYAAAPGEANVPFPGVEEAIRTLRASGCRLGICTNKPGAPTRVVVESHGWDRVIEVVIAGDTLASRKPDPAMLREAARLLASEPVIYVGDSEVDAATAEAAGIPFILFTEGYRKGPVETLPHRATFSHFSQLPRLVAEIVAATGAPRVI